MTAKVVYEGGLRTSATHVQSGTTIHTDAPTDNQGKGEAFSPTDLVGAALLACKITTMAIACPGRGWPEPKMTGTVTKKMASGPRRIARLELTIDLDWEIKDPEARKILEEIGRGCPVARSLHPDLEILATYNFL